MTTTGLPSREEGDLATRGPVVLACRVLEECGQGGATWGHVAVRARGGGGVWLTSGQRGCDETTIDDMTLVSSDGEVISGPTEIDVEYWIDLEIMRARPDVNAVVHTHPMHAVAFAATGWPLKALSHEGCYFVPPDVPRFDASGLDLDDRETGARLAVCLGTRNSVLIAHHGIITVGVDVGEAVALAVHLDRACEVSLVAGEEATGSSDVEALEKRQTHEVRMTMSWDYLVRGTQTRRAEEYRDMPPGRGTSGIPEQPRRGIRDEIVTACRVLDAATQGDMVWGHVSIRDPDGRGIWLKGSHRGFDEISEDEVILIDLDGTVLEGSAGRHVEYPIHTEIIANRPDIGAVVHTHPLYSIAFAATGWPLLPLSHEGSHFVPPDIARFTLSGDLIRTKDLGIKLAEALGDRNAILMPHHGIVTVGADIGQAVAAATHLDRACQIALLAGRDALPSSDSEALAKRARSARHFAMAWSYLSRTARRREVGGRAVVDESA